MTGECFSVGLCEGLRKEASLLLFDRNSNDTVLCHVEHAINEVLLRKILLFFNTKLSQAIGDQVIKVVEGNGICLPLSLRVKGACAGEIRDEFYPHYLFNFIVLLLIIT